MNPLSLVAILAGVFSLYALVASLVTGDTSQVDRLWSIAPIFYVWVFFFSAHQSRSRLLIVALLITAWGMRLTFNFARKGGYSGVEDYRWAILRARMSKWQFHLFNLFFIVLYQNFIIVMMGVPALMVYDHQDRKLSFADGFLAFIFVLLLIGEFIADQQQWDFHQEKKAIVRSGQVPRVRFLQTGLFKYSRHPNYFFEISQWWVIYVIGAHAASQVISWPIVGAVLLTLLFIGSTRFTEQISLGKYPEYVEYQRRTSAVIPWFSRAQADPIEATSPI